MNNNERSQRNLKQIEYNKGYYLDTTYWVDTIKANSDFEARIIFLYRHMHYDVLNDSIMSIVYSCNVTNILKHYYKIDKQYIDTVESHLQPIEIICYWRKEYFVEQKAKSVNGSNIVFYTFLISNIKHSTLSFLDMLRLKDRKFIKQMMKLKCFNIRVFDIDYQEWGVISTVTFVAINRILKKIRNTLYWHILRLF